jgi:hypothetical protein
LEAQRQQIERENSDVIYAIANRTTLAQVEAAALQQGFRPATDRVYVRSTATGAASAPDAASTAPLTAQAPLVANEEEAGSDLIEAVGRGLGAAGEWMQQAGAATVQSAASLTDQFTTEFTERWMP